MLAGNESPLAGLGNHLFFRPVSAFVNPAVLGASLPFFTVECSMDQFPGLPITRRVEAQATFQLTARSGIGGRVSSIGKGSFNNTQAALAYGMQLSASEPKRTAWQLGALLQYNQLFIQPAKPGSFFTAGIATAYRLRKQAFNLLLAVDRQTSNAGRTALSGALTEIQLNFYHCYQLSELVSTEMALLCSFAGPPVLQARIQYSFLDNAFLRVHAQISPPMIAWEQGYRLKNSWLTVHCMRYPMIGWKIGLGIVWTQAKKHKRP